MASINAFSITSDRNHDKIVHESTTQYSQGASSSSTQSITNPYGAKCFITMAWSTNNVDFYPAQARVQPLLANIVTANAWTDASNIYFYLENNTGSTVTFYLRYALDTIT